METTMTATRIDRGSTDTMTIYSEGGDLVFERTFDAPREQVWKAFTDPELVPRWWGQHGTTTTVVEMDVRPGGTWRYVNSAADRDDVEFYVEYLEALRSLGLEASIRPVPVEVVEAIPFAEDRQHASYDAEAANRVDREIGDQNTTAEPRRR